jgi:hypothetical protein
MKKVLDLGVYFSSSKFYFYCGSIPKSWETREKIAEKKQEKKTFEWIQFNHYQANLGASRFNFERVCFMEVVSSFHHAGKNKMKFPQFVLNF